ncbi:hypothetical protein NMG60_11026870 [Bertholletia excelsa]
MKGSCTLIVSVLTASTVAVSSSTTVCGDHHLAFHAFSDEGHSGSSSSSSASSQRCGFGNRRNLASDGEKFTPRFDGLRFIETLVTAHR